MDEYTVIPAAIIGVLVLIVCTLFYALIYSGLFSPIEIESGKPPVENLFVAYKYFVGPYKNAGQCFTETTALVSPDHPLIGVYYDDPALVPVDQLRYIVGAVLAQGDEEPNELLRDKMRQNGYKLTTFPKLSYSVNTSFPHKTTMSIYIGILRVYPKISEYLQAHGLSAKPCIEIYDKGLINFMLPLSKQDDFFVPETQEDWNASKDGDTTYSEASSASDCDGAGPNEDLSLKMKGDQSPDDAGIGINGSSSEFEVINAEQSSNG